MPSLKKLEQLSRVMVLIPEILPRIANDIATITIIEPILKDKMMSLN